MTRETKKKKKNQKDKTVEVQLDEEETQTYWQRQYESIAKTYDDFLSEKMGEEKGMVET